MPSLPREFYELIRDADLPLDEESSEPLEELSAAQLMIVAKQAVDLLGAGWGSLLVDLGVPRESLARPLSSADLRGDAGYQSLLRGEHRLAPSSANDPADPLVLLVQRAFQAVAGRSPGAPKEFALPIWGADGSFGEETAKAITALQRLRAIDGIPNVFAQGEAVGLLAMLSAYPKGPDLFAPVLVDEGRVVPTVGQLTLPEQAELSPAVARIVSIATAITEATSAPFTISVQGKVYTYKADHFGVPPAYKGLLRAPGGIAYGLRPGHEYWKCNIFGGTVLALAEVPVPSHRVGKFRHFPRAERFGEKLGRSRGWKLVHHLDHRDPANPEAAVLGEAQNAEIRAMLADIRPGDVFFADNPGPPGSDGGHTRICIAAAAADDPDVAPLFAQARREAAMAQRDGMMRVSNGRQIQFWVVRYVG